MATASLAPSSTDRSFLRVAHGGRRSTESAIWTAETTKSKLHNRAT